MKVIDFHTHLPLKQNSAEQAFTAYRKELDRSGTEKAVLLPLVRDRIGNKSIAQACRRDPRIIAFAALDPRSSSAVGELKRAVEKYGLQGVKLHPRLENFSVLSKPVLKVVQAAGRLGVPVLVCAFPDSALLSRGNTPVSFGALAEHCPETQIVLAHAGGHYVMDVLMMIKKHKNLHMDISFSLSYYAGSSVPQDIVYAVKSLRGERVFYGSDFPERGMEEAIGLARRLFEENNVEKETQQMVFFKNASYFLSKGRRLRWMPEV